MTFGVVELVVIAAVIVFAIGPARVVSMVRRASREADKIDEVIDALPPGMQPRKWQTVRKGMQALETWADKQEEPEDVEEVDGPSSR